MEKNHPDAALIADLGGPAAVAKKLGWDKPGSVQRIQNWTVRGIPARVQLDHPDVFGKQEKAA
jgi:hypothetical protein